MFSIYRHNKLYDQSKLAENAKEKPTCILLISEGFNTFQFYSQMYNVLNSLLPTVSEERGVLGVRSIPVAILPSCRNMKTMAL